MRASDYGWTEPWQRYSALWAYDGNADLIWDGHELLAVDLWSGSPTGPGGATAASGTNATYDMRTSRWSALPATPDNGIYSLSSATWIGTAMLLWDGGQTGLAYDTASKTWSTFSAPAAPSLFQPVTVWTGQDLLVWGGENRRSGPSETTRAVAYRPPSS